MNVKSTLSLYHGQLTKKHGQVTAPLSSIDFSCLWNFFLFFYYFYFKFLNPLNLENFFC